MNETQLPDLAGIDWAGIWESTQTTGLEFAMKALIALVIFYVGRMIARLVTKGLRNVMQSQNVDKILETFVCNLAYWALMIFVIIAAINQIGVQTTSLIAVMGAAGLAVGLALQGSLANFAAGVLIVMFRPYRVGDFVEAAGISGVVLQVQILTTILKTGDNKQIIVPNGQVWGSSVVNYSFHDTRRCDIALGIAYEDDIGKAMAAIETVIKADSRANADPEPMVAVAELADSSVNFTVRIWCAAGDYWGLKFDMTRALKEKMDSEGISIPYPQQTVHMIQQSA